MHTRRAAIALLLAGSLAISACAGEPEPPEPPDAAPSSSLEAEATESAAPVGPAPEFASIADAARTMREAGLECTTLSRLEQDNPGLKDFALCDVGDTANRVDIYLFENQKRRDSWFGRIVATKLPWVFGPNWIMVIAGDPETAEERAAQIAEATGASVADVQF